MGNSKSFHECMYIPIVLSNGQWTYHNTVVTASLLRLHLELVKDHLDPMSADRGEDPDTLLLPGVGVRVVGARDLTLGRCADLKFTTPLLAVVPVVVEREPVLTGTLVGAHCVPTQLGTASIVHGTFVLVYDPKAIIHYR
jgi:hypothetical protein